MIVKQKGKWKKSSRKGLEVGTKGKADDQDEDKRKIDKNK
jgi:hypothetical protein